MNGFKIKISIYVIFNFWDVYIRGPGPGLFPRCGRCLLVMSGGCSSEAAEPHHYGSPCVY